MLAYTGMITDFTLENRKLSFLGRLILMFTSSNEIKFFEKGGLGKFYSLAGDSFSSQKVVILVKVSTIYL